MKTHSMGKPSLPRLVLAAWCFGLLVGLQGCATRMPCNEGVCKAEITIQSCEKGAMSVDPDPIPVAKPNNIEWTFATEGYGFPENGIVIEGSGFTNRPGASGNGRKFTVHDDHTDKRPDIKYAVRVTRRSDGAACAPYDPFISNH